MKKIITTILMLISFFSYFNIKDHKIKSICVIKSIDNISIFVYENDLLIGTLASIKNDKYIDAFNYLTINTNSLRNGVISFVYYDSILIDYKIIDDSIILNFNDDILKSDDLALAQIFLTYNILGFNKVYFKINGNDLDYFHNIYIKNGIYNGLINAKIISNDIINSKRIIIYNYLDNDEIIRYDYIVDRNVSIIDFIMGNIEIDYEIIGDTIKIDNECSNNYIKALDLTLKSNMLNYNIINND